MAVSHHGKHAGKSTASAKKSNKKMSSVSNQKSTIKETMNSSLQVRKGKGKQRQAKKTQAEKSQGQDRNEVPVFTTTSSIGFMDLSGELRNQIYREILHFEDTITIVPNSWTSSRRTTRGSASRTKMLSLLQVSSQIRKEAISIYYAENTFLYRDDIIDIIDYPASPAKPICVALLFRKWWEDVGAENLKWIKKLQIKFRLCRACNRPTRVGQPSDTLCDILPYAEFVLKHSNCKVELVGLATPQSPYRTYYSWDWRNIQPVVLSDGISIIKEPAWVEEIRAGNIVKIHGHIGGNFRINKVIYASEASNCTNREDRWQELCDKLSLPYDFYLKPESIRGGMRFMMQVQKRQTADVDMVDSV